VVVLTHEVGGCPFFQVRNSVHQMVPLIHQAANTFQLSAHLKNSVSCFGCNVSCNFTGSIVLEQV